MLKGIMKAVFGDKKVRDQKKLQPVVDEINSIHAELEKLSDEELKNKTHEFRKLLHAVPEFSRIGEGVVFFDNAEAFLNTHPDVEKCLFSSTRRDANPGELAIWIKLKEGSSASEDLAEQIKGGITRFGEHLKVSYLFFIDEFPMIDDERGKEVVDRHLLALATEHYTDATWREAKWNELAGSLKVEEKFEIDELLPEAFAVMKEVCRRMKGQKWSAAGAEITWEAVPYDVQLMGATALARGNIAEMATGEGKTLTAIMPLYLHALTCRGSHLVTVNDYLAKRDSEWNAPLFAYLRMLVGCLDKTESHTQERRIQYHLDVTYGTVNEFGFDYLRDNMARQRPQLVQHYHNFAIIDEVDSVLIDEARTPLIISGPVERNQDHYIRILPLVRKLTQEQNAVVSKLAKDAEELFEGADSKQLPWELGYRLLQCYKGLPKHKRYMRLRQEPSLQRLQEKVEFDLMRDKKMNEIEEDLFFLVDEKMRQVELTEKGRMALTPENPDYWVLDDIVDEFAKIEQNEELTEEERTAQKRDARAAYDSKAEELHAIGQLLHAHVLKIKDVDYVVEDNKVVIVDENTGRKMSGRRWSDGLHQAVEAKEGVQIEAETQTLATITIQNYFRMYKRLSGMTGTAETEAAEFHATYNMDVICVPTNRPLTRQDMQDLVYLTKREKYQAVQNEVQRLHAMNLPVLVGTTSVQDSELLARMFRQSGIEHEVLNAKNHLSEATIVAKAGQPGAVTIATNMAGRGTDIKLGEGVKEPHKDPETGEEWVGGLQIVGTERHESRRIDRQLRGRAGRQGDPGSSRFFVSLEDNLMLWFGSDRISSWLEKMGMQEGEAIESALVTRSISKAQEKVEMINYERRQRTLQYDNVMNKQREQVYGLRRELLVEEDVRPVMVGIFEDAIDAEFDMEFGTKDNMGDADVKGFIDWVDGIIATESLAYLKDRSWPDYEEIHEALMEKITEAYDEKMKELGNISTPFCRQIGLQTIDRDWQDHLLAIDDLREGVNLRGYGQKDPLVEFTHDATAFFEEFMLNVNKNIFQVYFRAQPMTEEEQKKQQRIRQMVAQKAQLSGPKGQEEQGSSEQKPTEPEKKNRRPTKGVQPFRRDKPRIGS